MAFNKEVDAFLKVYNELETGIVNDIEKVFNFPPDVVSWVKKMIEHNVKGGKMTRGLCVVMAVRCLAESAGNEPTEKQLHDARVLGWVIEWLQAAFLVADDIMDDSTLRRGKKCWYKHSHVGTKGINDSFILLTSVHQMLRKFFQDHPQYVHLIHLFDTITYITEMGQLMDLTTETHSSVQSLAKPEAMSVTVEGEEDDSEEMNEMDGGFDFSGYTLDRYRQIVVHKTAHYSFYLPVAAALIMMGIIDQPTHVEAKTILLTMGEYFQIQDDALDCFGDPEVIGKVGTDIQDGKCSWLVVQALRWAGPTQRRVLQKHYGKDDEEGIKAVKEVYQELNLLEMFQTYEMDTKEQIDLAIDQTKHVPKNVYKTLLQKVFKRKK
eukprot:TRINITY_DN559_c0_g1_i1.p1 TRINITY_DN559_c0_g1~~TRINITY_DN559_c0_g1_i1.p1  ORF type:complete len:379 (-),score=107.22 TRINITY_DN559_c0_g1_i1:160-1296(-)